MNFKNVGGRGRGEEIEQKKRISNQSKKEKWEN